MKYYISGKIGQGTEQEQNANKEIISAWTKFYRFMGYEIVSPLELDHSLSKSWQDYMRTDIQALMGCDAIIMLPNWIESKGAKIEHDLAKVLGMPITYAH